MIRIVERTSGSVAASELVIDTQFSSLDPSTLEIGLAGFSKLETALLERGLGHGSPSVRLQSLRTLREQGAFLRDAAQNLIDDEDATVRGEALDILRDSGRVFSEKEVRQILIRPSRGLGARLLTGSLSRTGDELFRAYQIKRLKSMRESELRHRVESALPYDDDAYFVLAERRFSSYEVELRLNVDARFQQYVEERIRRLEALPGDARGTEILNRIRASEESTRKALTRQGLDVLCREQRKEDLNRIRGNLASGFAGSSEWDASYFEKHGTWEDLLLLVKAEPAGASASRLFGNESDRYEVSVASFANKLGKKSGYDLMSVEMPPRILRKVVETCSPSVFLKTSDAALFFLLDHTSDEVRRAACIKVVRSFPIKRTRQVLEAYIQGENHRYYNVVHWLDLGVSMSRAAAIRVAAVLA